MAKFMSRVAKMHLWSAVYCCVLISLNWYWKTDYARTNGVTSETMVWVGGAFFISVSVVVVLGWRALKHARWRLEQGVQGPEGRWSESWSVLLYALPLLWQRVSTSSWRAPDGAMATSSGGFGHTLSSTVFLLAVAGLLLAQMKNRLSTR